MKKDVKGTVSALATRFGWNRGHRSHAAAAALSVSLAALTLSFATLPLVTGAQTAPARPVTGDPVLAKECGACHMVYPALILPARSWRLIMGSLRDHFGENAELDPATQARLTDYLVANAADRSTNRSSIAVMQSVPPGVTPPRITRVPLIANLHATVLEPEWGGNPRPKSLSECSVCHYLAESGNFFERRFGVTDHAFRAK